MRGRFAGGFSPGVQCSRLIPCSKFPTQPDGAIHKVTLGRLNFDEIDESDLVGLIESGVPEGLTTEYKRNTYGASDSARNEALKDVSSFANSSGGHLLIGMDADNGIPTRLTGLEGIEPGSEIDRLENLIRDGIEPRLIGLRIRAVPLSDGGNAIVARIPKSWSPPHRASARNINKFYVRNSGGVHEASVEELRSLFSETRILEDRVRGFRAERLAKIAADEGSMPIVGGGRIVLHIVPFSAFGRTTNIDLERALALHRAFSPLGNTDRTPRINFDGFINVRGGEQCYGYTQIFRQGMIEATKSDILRGNEGNQRLPAEPLGNHIFGVLPDYLEGLKQLDVPTPLTVMISLQNIYGANLAMSVPDSEMDYIPPFNRTDMLLPEIIIPDYDIPQTYHRLMRPAFDALWNAAGYSRCTYFNAQDQWTGQIN